MSDVQSNYPLEIRSALNIPHVEAGMRIGIFGGSFNPPHEGHLNVSELALKRMNLDRIWWLVTPGNPLKDHSNLAPLAERITACRKLAKNPKTVITAFEVGLKTRFTADTLQQVVKRRARAKFVWVMGADNLTQFHQWQDWKKIAALLPIAVIDRPGSTLFCRSSQAAIALLKHRVDESDAAMLPFMQPPAWAFIHGPRSHLSSSAIRNSSQS